MGNVEQHENLASELLGEVKASAKRWFFIAMAELLAIIILIALMIFVPVEESHTSIEQESDNGSYNQIIGGDYGEAEGSQDIQEAPRSR